ncbi:MAG: pyruvate ferredoxin oxidoreductase [Chloroflexi bacterium]|nr:pyruvate ferredoxin oxidoreductase [Chloroflexota bacterium]MBM3174400.1 pyruvate ferredoxin oxidoreductase [Chloroflexota bacterium]MBM4449962.1 pyruvate ferredoxin oxidoreductase [Chloroflexota bacterium]
MRRKEIRIAGFGGQGIVLSGSIVGKAASIYDGKFAVLTQSYGPESRGGACRAEVVISESPIDYPYVIDPQVQVILSQEAYREYGQVGQPDTLVMVDSDLVNFDRFVNPMPLRIPASRMAQELGRPVVANIIVLGFLAAKSDIVSYKALRKAILDSIPRGTEDLNMKAFEMGYKYDSEHTNGS